MLVRYFNDSVIRTVALGIRTVTDLLLFFVLFFRLFLISYLSKSLFNFFSLFYSSFSFFF